MLFIDQSSKGQPGIDSMFVCVCISVCFVVMVKITANLQGRAELASAVPGAGRVLRECRPGGEGSSVRQWSELLSLLMAVQAS